MSTRKKPRGQAALTKFKVGDRVRVKHGTRDIDYPDMPLGGWAGTVTETQGADRFIIDTGCWSAVTNFGDGSGTSEASRLTVPGSMRISGVWVLRDSFQAASDDPALRHGRLLCLRRGAVRLLRIASGDVSSAPGSPPA